MPIHRIAVMCGIVCGGIMAGMALIPMWQKRTSRFVDICARVYFGYAATWMGALAGMCLGFLDGFISSFIILWLWVKFF